MFIIILFLFKFEKKIKDNYLSWNIAIKGKKKILYLLSLAWLHKSSESLRFKAFRCAAS